MAMDDEFDWTCDPKTLRLAYHERNFDAQFIKKIAKDVVLVLSPQLLDEPHNSSCDEELVQARLLGPLEKFICQLTDDVQQDEVKKVFDSIQASDRPSKLCRRILKSGDVSFSCNDCALDGTCVLCIDCFLKSAHKDHNYKMCNNPGGGCCDCGDIEAWKQNHACLDHSQANQPPISLSDFDSKESRSKQVELDKKNMLETIGSMPNKFATRYFLVCQASLRYALNILTWTDYERLPPCLEVYDELDKDQELLNLLSSSKTKKNFFTVLFNDEVHTYDHVIATLVKIIKCTKMTASIMASTISREGRSLIVQDTQNNCDSITTKISQVRDGTQGPLKVATIHGKILAHQAFAIKLVEWIRKMSSLCEGLRILTAYTLLGNGDLPGDSYPYVDTMFERIALSNTKLWKIARVEWNDLFVKTLLTDYSIKQEISRLITRNYDQLVTDFIYDDHDHSVSILTLTTQLYTVSSLTCMLIEEESALSTTLGTFVSVCKKAKRENAATSFENRHTFDMLPISRAYYAIHDFRHLINLKPTKWSFQLRKSVIEAMNLFLDLLELLQGMDPVKRQLGQHLEYEPDWESGINLQTKLIAHISRFIEFLAYDEEVLVESVSETLTRLSRICRYKGYLTRELFGHRANCINYDVTTMPVSIHLPLTRFAAALIVLLMQRRPNDDSFDMAEDEQSSSVSLLAIGATSLKPYDERLVVIPRQTEVKGKMSMIEIVEPSLRCEVMIAQFRSGMWRRNGYSLVNQIVNFHSSYMRKEMFDRDILVLQECAAMCEANQFMIHLINKFNLFNWVSSETVVCQDASSTTNPSTAAATAAANKSNEEEMLTQTLSLGDEFLQLLLIIVGERYAIGIGQVSEEDILMYEIIQLLCVCPMARSDLTNKMDVRDQELDCIKQVAELKRSSSTTTGKYELREQFYDRFNPFFYHYSRRYQSNALDAQLKRKKNLGHKLICCPPPKPVELTEQFKNLNELLKCDILLVLIEKILTRSLRVINNNTQQETTTTTTKTSTATATNKSKSKEPTRFSASELQLDQCLHLIGLGLWEQERDSIGFKYLDAAHSKGIFNLVRDNYEKGERSKDLLMWLMQKTNALADTVSQQQASDSSSSSTMEICADIKRVFASSLQVADQSNKESRKEKLLLASQRRERILKMMKANQDKFLSYQTTKELVADTEKHEAPKVQQQHTSIAQQQAGPSGASTSSSLTSQQRQRKTKPPKSVMGSSSSRKMNKSDDTPTRQTSIPQQQHATATAPATDKLQESLVEMDDQSTNTTIQQDSMNLDKDQEMEAEEDDDEQETEFEPEFELDSEQKQQAKLIVPPEPLQMCILCRDEQQIDFDKPTMVLLAFVQRSAVLSCNRKQRRIPNYSIIPQNQTRTQLMSRNSPFVGGVPTSSGGSTTQQKLSYTSDNSWSFDATFMPSDLFFSPHISSCGHVMHYDCWRGYTEAVLKRETNRLNRSARHLSFEPDKHEILCPLCDCISNATIPLLPNYTSFASRYASNTETTTTTISKQQRQQTAPMGSSASSAANTTALALANPESVFNLSPETVNRTTSENLSSFLNALRSCVDTLKQIRHTKELGTSPSTSASTSASIHLATRAQAAAAKHDRESQARQQQQQQQHYYYNEDGKYLRLFQPRQLNDVLVELDEMGALGLRQFLTVTRANRVHSAACSKTLLSSMTALAERIHLVGLDLDRCVIEWRTFLMTSWTVAYTLQTYERVSRFKGTPIFNDLQNSSKSMGLTSLLRYSFASMMTQQSDMIQSLLIRKLRYLLISDEHLTSSPCCLDIDAYETLVSLLIMLPKLYSHIDNLKPLGNDETTIQQQQQQSYLDTSSADPHQWITQKLDVEYNRNLIHLMLILNLVQICITYQTEIRPQPSDASGVKSIIDDSMMGFVDEEEDATRTTDDVHMKTTSDTEFDEDAQSKDGGACYELMDDGRDLDALESFYRDCIIASGHPNGKLPAVNRQFCRSIRARMLPFLRSTAMLMYYVSLIPFPENLKTKSAFKRSPDDAKLANSGDRFDSLIVDGGQVNAEFNSLCHYLNLPRNFANLLQNHEARHLARSWLRHSRVLVLIKSELEKSGQQQPSSSSRLTEGLAVAKGSENLDQASSSEETSNSSDETPPPPQRRDRTKQADKDLVLSKSYPTTRSHTSARLHASLREQQQHHLQQQQSIASELMLPIKLIGQPHLVPRLIELPYDYSELVDRVSDFTCPSIKNQDSRTPTMCLVCGVILCSHSYCCQRDLNDLASDYYQLTVQRQITEQNLRSAASTSGAGSSADNQQAAPASGRVASWLPSAVSLVTNQAAGNWFAAAQNAGQLPAAAGEAAALAASISQFENAIVQHQQQRALAQSLQQLVGSCTYHAYECSGGIGIFLRIRKCQILMLSGKTKGCYQAAPYNDDHGETDYGLVRGNPLHLNREQYRKIEQAWLQHSVAEQISRQLEYSPYFSSVNWYLH